MSALYTIAPKVGNLQLYANDRLERFASNSRNQTILGMTIANCILQKL